MIQSPARPHVVWACPGALAHALDAATWLDTARELRQLGWRVTLTAAGQDDQRCVRGVEVLCIPRPNVYFLRQLLFHGRLLRLILRQWRTVDVILFHQMSAPWLLPLRLLRSLMRRQRPLLVMDIRSLHMPSKQAFKDKLRGVFQGLMGKVAQSWVDGCLVITQRMAEAVGVPAKKLWGTWPSGVNVEQFASAQTIRCWPLPGEPIHLVYIGALHYERNLLTLSQAVELANAEGMAFRLTLMGEGTARQELENFAATSAGRIRVLRPVPHDQIPEVLARAHVGVLPFPDEEKFRVSSPIKLFEYMAAGLPILATRIVCHTDVVGSGEYAFWAKDSAEPSLVDALRLIWQSENSLSDMGKHAAISAKDWTWTASAMKLKQALEFGTASCGHTLRTLSDGSKLL